MFNSILNKIIHLNRFAKQLIMVLSDSILVTLALLGSFSIRLGYLYWPQDIVVWVIFIAPAIAIPIFVTFRLFRSVVRYMGAKALWSITQAITLYAVIWGLVGYEFSRWFM